MEDPIASTGIIGHEDVGSPGITKVSDLIDVDALVGQKRGKKSKRPYER